MALDTHPTLPEFEYIRPGTLIEASDFLGCHATDARPFLGGTDVFVRMRDGFMTPKFLVDVKNLPGMSDLHFDPLIGVNIGAAVNMNRVISSPEIRERYPLLADACRSVASYQLRNRATIVGNICNASPAGDTLGACLIFDGQLQIHGPGGMRRELLADFFLSPGKTKLKAGDVAIALQLPPPPMGSKGAYLKLGRNKLSDLAIVAVTAFGYPVPTAPSGYRFRLVLASVAPVPFVAKEAEAYLANTTITPDSIREAACLAADACAPIDDLRGSVRYRKQMVKNLSTRALSEVWEKLKQQAMLYGRL
jgi:carbon-monoxide dehydrogenase medium subunit